jgi:hypothetical protein
MKEPVYDLYRLLEDACENLPDDWEIELTMRRGEAGCRLIDPDGEEAEYEDDDLNLHRMVQERINKARGSDGLGPIDFEDQPATK